MTEKANNSENFLKGISNDISADKENTVLDELVSLIQPEQYIGDLINLDYDYANILIHDTRRTRVNGIPYGCFLIASRITPSGPSLTGPEDARGSLLLLRVSGSTRLNSEIDIDRTRFEIVQRSNDTELNFDDSQQTDQFTLNLLRYSGVKCRILGTFRLYKTEPNAGWQLHFGADISNFYAGQGMKIYKPNGDALQKIVNYRSKDSEQVATRRIGCLRYSAAVKEDNTPESVPVEITAEDFIAQRTALFGMTRTGKSNTTKTIVAALFKLRESSRKMRVGQLIFDPNGEYANDNPQDQGCIRNLKHANSDEVHTYGQVPHPYDPDRNITKFNFYGATEPMTPPQDKDSLDDPLRTLYEGRQIINDALAGESAGYIKEFRNVDLKLGADSKDHGDYKRFRRRLFLYRSILAEAGFKYRGRANVKALFSQAIRDQMEKSDDMRQYANLLKGESISWVEAGNFAKALAAWVKEKEFKKFDANYASLPSGSGKNWSDPHFLGLLRFYDDTRARALTQNTRVWHDLTATGDYADQIVDQVRKGNLVIFDQVLGEPNMNQQSAERIIRRIFEEQQRSFSQPQFNTDTGKMIPPPPVIIYAEEAHTLLPRASEDDSSNIWARIAKEGAKFNIGVVYSTQEPSSIQTNILKNTENWFIAHLNNTDETNQLSKYKDFADFTQSIINVEEAGLVKVRTASGKFTIPVQIDRFAVPTATNTQAGKVSTNPIG